MAALRGCLLPKSKQLEQDQLLGADQGPQQAPHRSCRSCLSSAAARPPPAASPPACPPPRRCAAACPGWRTTTSWGS